MATTTHQIGLADNGRTMSLDEFRDAEEEEGYRYELAHGVLEVSEVPNDPHARTDARGRRHAALAVDLVSVGCETRDHETKREEYLVYGLQDYWIVDPEAQKATVLSRRDDP